MFERTPTGWAKTTLGEVTEPTRVRALPTEAPGMPYVGLENVESQTMNLLGHGYAHEIRGSSLRFSKGDVLYGKMRPYLNKVWVAQFDGICSAEFLVFPKREGLNSEFLALRLNADDFVSFASRQVSGERPRVDFGKLSNFPLLLPPIAEQGRISIRVNAALIPLRRAEMAAVRAQERLQRYHFAVVEATVYGGLTSDWREGQRKRKGPNIESGESVLDHLLAIRRNRWEKAELMRLRQCGKMPRNDRWKSRYPQPTPPLTAGLPALPETWACASLEMIAEIGSGISVSRNRRLEKAVVLPYLRVANVQRGRIDLSEVRTIRVEEHQTAGYLLRVGDILFTEGGDRDKLGRGWIWEGQIQQCLHQNHIFRARLFDLSQVNPKLVSYWANTFGLQFFAKHGKQTTNLASINRRILAKFPVPIPPREEQTHMLSELDNRLGASHKLAAALEKQLGKARSARQSLLRDAFEGRLVPQNQDEEPAREVLKRIRDEKAHPRPARRVSRQVNRPTKKLRSDFMREPLPSTQVLRAAWEKIGRRADARRLFIEAGFDSDHIVQFYEGIRSIPELRAAFLEEANKGRQPQTLIRRDKDEHRQRSGRFRLRELWLEDFKNLKDYVVRFNPLEALDVVLGWNGTGKSNLFEALVIIFRDLHNWREKNRWPDQPMHGFSIKYEVDEHIVEVNWRPAHMKRPGVKLGPISCEENGEVRLKATKREQLLLPRFVFGYYSGPTNRLAEHFLPMKQDHYERLRLAQVDDAKTLARLLEQRRFFCAENHHAKYVLLAFSYKKDPKISEFLENRLRILGFESALFIIRRPPWAKSGSRPEDFWGATGIMRRVMERLRTYAIAPMVLKQKISYGNRSTTEDHYYFFLPDLESLHSFAAEYQDARTFFLALESTDFSELIHDVNIQVRVRSNNSDEVSITFHQLSEGEQQLLMVLGLMRFTKSHQSLVLLDEPDTHLNPHWSVDYLKDLSRVMSEDEGESKEQQTSQILMATHDPLAIASLLKEQIHLLKRDVKTGACRWEPASVNPRGLGFTGILTSEMFGFRSDLDSETLADLDRRVRLVTQEGSLNPKEAKELEVIDKRLVEAGFSKAFSDPYYAAFVRAWGRRYSELMAGQQFVTPEQQRKIDQIASEVLKEALEEVEKEVKS